MLAEARTRRTLFASAGILLGLASLLAPSIASAYCRTRTLASGDPIGSDDGEQCNDGPETGVPLFWRNACVSYNVNRAASREVALADVQRVAAEAFAKWTGATCNTDSSSGATRPSIDVRDLGPVDCNKAEYNQNGPNQNVIFFNDDSWFDDNPDLAAGADQTLALTLVQFNKETGELYTADIAINTARQDVSVSSIVPAGKIDLASVITHEAGHFFGFAHSDKPSATMYASYNAGDSRMRNLSRDDLDAVCFVYRPDGKRAVLNNQVTPADACDPTPRHGFSGACGGEGEPVAGHGDDLGKSDKGCAVAPSPGSRRTEAGGGESVVAICALGLLGAIARARRAR